MHYAFHLQRINYIKIDLDELKKDKENNFKERLEFIDRYVEWLKVTPNKACSKQHKDFIDSAYQNRNIQKCPVPNHHFKIVICSFKG